MDLIATEKRTIAAFIMECTELPPYSDALRAATGLPVWDAITGADFYISAYKDNPRFGLDDWQTDFDGTYDDYHFGDNLIKADKTAVQMTGALKAHASVKT